MNDTLRCVLFFLFGVLACVPVFVMIKDYYYAKGYRKHYEELRAFDKAVAKRHAENRRRDALNNT